MSESKCPISACVITRDEEDHIERCLASLSFCADVVVVDSGSRDRTCELARSLGARVLAREWDSFGPQKNFAVEHAEHDWVLCLDADEWLSDELRDEIRALAQDGLEAHAGWDMPRLSNYLGTWVRRGGWYPDRQLRLYDRRAGRWGGRAPHEHVELRGTAGSLRARLLHEPYRSLDDHLGTIDRYTSIQAASLHAAGRRAGPLDLVLRPAWRFLSFYLLKGAFTLGWIGLHLAYLDAHYARMKYAKLLALGRGLRVSGRP